MNPALNAETLRNRLWVIEHYKYRYGADHTYWVHALLRKGYGRVFKYKFNYLVKAFLAYQAYAAYQNYSYVDSMSLMTPVDRMRHRAPIAFYSGVFLGACALF